jgi:teichuronic acid biosynthesis protein TuaE
MKSRVPKRSEFHNRRLLQILSLERILLYLTIIAGFIGPAFFLIPIGPIHLFPYRIFLALLWMLFAMGLLSKRGRLNASHIKVKPYLQFLAFWLLYALLSLAWAANKADAARDIIFLFMAVSTIFFTVYYFSNKRDLERFYYLWLLIMVAFIPIGLWENLTGNHLSVSGLIGAPQSVIFMPSAVFSGPNEFATFLALSIPLVLAFIRYQRGFFARASGCVGLVTSFYLLIATGSRANYISVILEFAFLFVVLLKLRQKLKAALIIGLLILGIFVAFPQLSQQAFNTMSSQLASIMEEWELSYGSTGIRINLIKNSLIFLARTGTFGVGAGNAEYWMENLQVYPTYGIINPHNWWAEVLVQYGVFIFTGYLLFYLSLIIKLYAIYYRLSDKTERMVCEGLLVGLVGFSFASISSSSIMALNPHWLLFAFGLAFLNYCRNRREAHV